MKNIKETSHNPTAIRQAYEIALETVQALLGGDEEKANQLREIVKTLMYKSTKDAGHVAGMPAKLWQRALLGVGVDSIMESIFGDPKAGMVARAALGDKPNKKKGKKQAPAPEQEPATKKATKKNKGAKK